MGMRKTTAVIGGGTMGADIAVSLARAGCTTHVVETGPEQRERLAARMRSGLAELGCPERFDRIVVHAGLADTPWPTVDVVIEAIPEKLEAKQALFMDLVGCARRDALLTSNSSAIPISEIAAGLPTRERMFGLHYFMPAHFIPCVEVVCSKASDPALAETLCAFMRATGKVPVLVRKDIPGFLANRLQHALCREAFALIEAGIATPEDIDRAVRFSFGFRYLAVGPVLQRDHAGLDVHYAAAARMYPDLAANTEPSEVLRQHVRNGHLGIKSGHGFFAWTPESIAREKTRYDRLLRAALEILGDEVPRVEAD